MTYCGNCGVRVYSDYFGAARSVLICDACARASTAARHMASPRATLVMASGRRIVLEVVTDDPRSHYGTPVLLIPLWEEHPATVWTHRGSCHDVMPESQDILDGMTYRALRDLYGCSIETDHPLAICRALGVPEGEPGITLCAR